MSRPRKTHGMTGTREYSAWTNLRQRVLSPDHVLFPAYGGRGITIHPRWERFENFLEDLGFAPPGMWLGRRDPDGPYAPGNALWMTRQESITSRRPPRRKPEAQAA